MPVKMNLFEGCVFAEENYEGELVNISNACLLLMCVCFFLFQSKVCLRSFPSGGGVISKWVGGCEVLEKNGSHVRA